MSADHAIAHLSGLHTEPVEGCPGCFPPRVEVSPEVRSAALQNGLPLPPPTGRKCGCGCGASVKRKFLPGHDAKLKSALVKRARNGDQKAAIELEGHGWGHFI